MRADRVGSWSGAPFYMVNALQRAGAQVENLVLPEPRYLFSDLMKRATHKTFFRKTYLHDRSPARLAVIRRALEAQLPGRKYDLIFSPSSKYIAVLGGISSAVFWTDACFSDMVGYYEEFSNLTQGSIDHAERVELNALNRAAAVLYSSQWAANGAARISPENAAKLRVVPFGANVSEVPTRDEALAACARRRGPVKLLFAGVDWRRKGGAFALQVLRACKGIGLDVEIDLLGAVAPDSEQLGDLIVRQHGFISKATPEGRARIRALLHEAHWLLLPTRAECCAVVLAEAAAHAVPALTTAVGGNETAVVHGETGFLFSLDRPPEIWAEKIYNLSRDPLTYRNMAIHARAHYEAALNWDVAGRRAVEVFEFVLKQGSLPNHPKPPALKRSSVGV